MPRTSPTPTNGLRRRILVALGAPGGYETAQIIERFGPAGLDVVRYLLRSGYAATTPAGRIVRTPAGDAASPTRRQLAGLERRAA
jgi:hypothetical protein